MTPAILRAAQDARYVLMVRKQYSEAAREQMFEFTILQLTTALQEHDDTFPEKEKRKEQPRWDRNRGMYMTDEDRYGE